MTDEGDTLADVRIYCSVRFCRQKRKVGSRLKNESSDTIVPPNLSNNHFPTGGKTEHTMEHHEYALAMAWRPKATPTSSSFAVATEQTVPASMEQIVERDQKWRPMSESSQTA